MSFNSLLEPIKESIKHVPVMKYALAVVGLAATAALVFSYLESEDFESVLIKMGIVVLFMVVLILVTNIPRLKHIRVFVSVFLGFILLLIMAASIMIFIDYFHPGGFTPPAEKLSIDVQATDGTALREGIVALKLPGKQELTTDIYGGVVDFDQSLFTNPSALASFRLEIDGYKDSIIRVSVETLLAGNFLISLEPDKKSETTNKPVPEPKDVTLQLSSGGCETFKEGLSRLSVKTPPAAKRSYSLSIGYSGSIDLFDSAQSSSLYKYDGGHLIIKIDGQKTVEYPDLAIAPLGLTSGAGKIGLQNELKNRIKALSCSFNNEKWQKLINAL